MKKNHTVCIQPLIIFTFCLMFFCHNPALVQSQNVDARKGVLPSKMVDTRSLSMASTTIADVYGTPSIGINAALSGLFNQPSFIQLNSNHNWDNNLKQHHLMLPTLSKGRHHITARFGFLQQGFEHISFPSSSSLHEPNIIIYRAELAYAIAISNYFSLGTLQSISYTSNEDEQNWNYFTDVGLVYAPDSPVSYGLVFRGLGHETTYTIIGTGQSILGSRLARQSLEVGATLRYPIEEKAWLSISFANEKQFDEKGLWYKGGFEIIPFSFIDIRGGAMVNFNQSLIIPRMGLGINAGVFQIDYMVAPKNLIGEQFHQFGLTIQF